MSKMKLLLDVVSDLRSLADSLQAVADAVAQGGQEQPEHGQIGFHVAVHAGFRHFLRRIKPRRKGRLRNRKRKLPRRKRRRQSQSR